MSISVNPILPVVATQGTAPQLVLQPGTVVDARVLKLLSDNLVRIAIANLSIDVLSEIPLSAGQTLQLAVSEMDGGIRLAVVGQGGAAGTPSDTVTLAPDALIDAAAKPSVAAAANQLTPLERLAVSAAVQTAASQQGSLSHLFANLGAVAGAGGLPLKLQQAVMQVLAQQTSLDQNLTGGDIKNAFQKSGLFLEASLASGSVSSAAGMPDLKAALIVLRQTLVSTFGTADAAQSSAALTSSPHVAATSPLVPFLSADADLQDALLPPARVAGAVDALAENNAGRIVLSAAVQAAASQQGSLSHLFANLGAVAGAGGLPPKLQQAVMQVLAQQTSLDQNLTGADIKNAFQKSGLFLEASLASGSVSSAAGMPDLKAALIVLRQTLVSTFGTAGAAQSAAALASSPHVAATSTLVPSLSADADLQDVLLPPARDLLRGHSESIFAAWRALRPALSRLDAVTGLVGATSTDSHDIGH